MRCLLLIMVLLLCTFFTRAQQVLPAITLTDVHGKRLSTGDLRGKVIFINFWALSCIPCREELPGIDSMRAFFAGDGNLVVLPIDLGNDAKAAQGYFALHKLGLPEYTVAGVLPEVYFRGVLPTTLVIDKQGRIVFFKEEQCAYNTTEFREKVREWLGQ